ncbi:MAG: hypothetical protein AAFQ80_05505 [Cyanobacteria bacterium J06621_8]
MATKRYKILEGALKYLETGNSGNNPQAPAGTALRAYQEIRGKERNATYTRDSESLVGEFIDAAVNPFGVDFDDANKYIIPLSKRVDDLSALSSVRTAGHLLGTVPTEAKRVRGFEPAKAVVSVPDASLDNDNAQSQITLLRYKKKGRRSYVVPFGAGSNTDKVKAVRAEILAALPTNGNYSVSFKDEII